MMTVDDMYGYLNALHLFRVDEKIIYPCSYYDRKRWVMRNTDNWTGLQ